MFSKSKSDSKAGALIDRLLWTFMWVLPIVIWFFTVEFIPETLPFFEWVDVTISWSFIADIFDAISSAAFGSSFILSGYISYLVQVEIVHVLFDVVVFIPRFAHKVIDKVV